MNSLLRIAGYYDEGLGAIVPHQANLTVPTGGGGGLGPLGGGGGGSIPPGEASVAGSGGAGSALNPIGRTTIVYLPGVGQRGTFQPTAQGARITMGTGALATTMSPMGVSGAYPTGGLYSRRMMSLRQPWDRPDSGLSGLGDIFGDIGRFVKKGVRYTGAAVIGTFMPAGARKKAFGLTSRESSGFETASKVTRGVLAAAATYGVAAKYTTGSFFAGPGKIYAAVHPATLTPAAQAGLFAKAPLAAAINPAVTLPSYAVGQPSVLLSSANVALPGQPVVSSALYTPTIGTIAPVQASGTLSTEALIAGDWGVKAAAPVQILPKAPAVLAKAAEPTFLSQMGTIGKLMAVNVGTQVAMGQIIGAGASMGTGETIMPAGGTYAGEYATQAPIIVPVAGGGEGGGSSGGEMPVEPSMLAGMNLPTMLIIGGIGVTVLVTALRGRR
jgi:hypothetical protein